MRRILKRHLEKYDVENNTSLLRELEMSVDNVLAFNQEYAIQYWRDMELYGLGEANAYLDNFLRDKTNQFKQEAKAKHLELSSRIREQLC